MPEQALPIADEAKDGLAVAPPDPTKDGDTGAAGSGGDDERDGVDLGSEDSMGASDPPSTSAPGSHRDVDQPREIGRQQDS